MADNVAYKSDATATVATFATDDASGVHYQYVKLAFGANDTQNLVSSTSTNPLPVALSDTDNAVLDNIDTDLTTIAAAVYVDDADWTDGSSSHLLMGGLYQSTMQTITDGDVGPLQVDSNGRVIISPGTALDVSAATLTVQVSDTSFAVADGNALGEGVLIQGDDGTDRKNINVDATTGDVQVDVTNTVTVDLGSNNDVQGAAAEGAAVSGNPFLIAGDDGTNVKHVAVAADGAVHIDDGGNSITIDGTVTADAGTGTFTVDNAGTFAVQIDGDALTALQLLDDIVYTDDTSTHATGTSKGALFMAAATPTDTSVGANDIGAVAMSTDRRLHVDSQIVGQDADITIADGGNSITVDGSLTTVSTVTNLAQMNGAAISMGTGLDGVGVQRVTLATDIALPTGTNTIGKLAANSGTDIGDVDVTSIAAGSNLIGDVGIQGRTTGGLSIYYDNDLDETAVAVKAAAGTLYGMHVINLTAAPLYLQLFDVAQGSVTVGTTTPTVQFVVPGNADSDGAGFTFNVPQGIAFATAITAAATTNSEGNGAPGANECHCNLFYK